MLSPIVDDFMELGLLEKAEDGEIGKVQSLSRRRLT